MLTVNTVFTHKDPRMMALKIIGIDITETLTMKRKYIPLLAAVTTAAIIMTGCTYTGGADREEPANEAVEEEAAPEAGEDENDESSEYTEAPEPADITLIPEDTNYDEPEIEEAEELTEHDFVEEDDTLIVASEPDAAEEGDELVETDEIIGREGNWATATDGVNVRSEAHGGEIIGSIEAGTRVKVLGVEGNWFIINYEGQTAYVYSEYFD